MATVKPFQCVRPNESVAARVAALPYDVYNRSEACAEVAREPLSFLRIDRAETQFPDSVDTYAPEVYQKAKEMLDEAMADGTYLTDDDRTYYIYELTMDGRRQTGIVACASIDDYSNNVIKKHENTRAEKEIDRITHVDTCSAQTGPIFLAYRANEVINAEVNRTKENTPLYDFTSPDGIRHTVWKITDGEAVTKIENAFAGIGSRYIPNVYLFSGATGSSDLTTSNLEDILSRNSSPVFPFKSFTTLLYGIIISCSSGKSTDRK